MLNSELQQARDIIDHWLIDYAANHAGLALPDRATFAQFAESHKKIQQAAQAWDILRTEIGKEL